MAAPFPTTYYLAIGTSISNVGVLAELSGGSYARLACAFTGTALSGLTQTTTAWVVATAPTPAVNSYYGAIFDSLTLGNMVAYWTWNSPYTGSLTAFPITTINIGFNQQIKTALNMALSGGHGSSGSLIDSGAQIGTAQGNPLIAGCRLGISPGGSLVPHVGSGQWIGSADVQGNLSVGSLATNNVLNGVVALAGGANSTLTPVMTGFYNRVITVASGNDSVALPAPTAAPVGSILFVTNSAASNAMKLFPDTGAVINAAASSLVVSAGTSCIMVRATPVQWISIPLVPS